MKWTWFIYILVQIIASFLNQMDFTYWSDFIIVIIFIIYHVLLFLVIVFSIFALLRCTCNVINSLYRRYIYARIRDEFEPEDLDPQPTPIFNLTLNNPLDPWIYRFRGVEVPDPYARVYFVNQDIKNDQDDNDYKELSEV